MSNSSNQPPSQDVPLSFEAALADLESIVHDLEEGELGLAESLARYEQGVSRLRHCYDLLEKAERKIEILTGLDASGNPATASFGDQQVPLPEQAGARRRRSAARPLLDEGEAECGETT